MRHHNSVSKLSESQLPNLINRDPLHHDHASAMFTKWGKHEGLPSLHGNPKQQIFSQEQARPLVSSGQEAWSGSTLQTSSCWPSNKPINWVHCNTQPTLSSDSEGSKQVEQSGHFENAWKRLSSKHSDNDARQQSVTHTSESSSRPVGFGIGFGSFASSKIFRPGMSKRSDVSMAPTTPQKVWKKITLHSLPSNAVSHNLHSKDPSKTSLATGLLASPEQNNQNLCHSDSKVPESIDLQGYNKAPPATLTIRNIASSTNITNNQNSTKSANTFFQQHWNIKNGQMMSMSGWRTANGSPSVDATVEVKTDPSNNSLATSLSSIASVKANTQIPLCGEIKVSEATDLQGDSKSPSAASLKKSNVASTNINKNHVSTENASTLFGNLRSGQMISLSDTGTASALPTVNDTVVDETPRKRNRRTGHFQPRLDATDVVKTPRKRFRTTRLQSCVDVTEVVKTPRKRSRTRRIQSSMDATEVVKRPKKRSAAMSEHKETPQNLSIAELEWARVATCLPEKVNDNTPLSETEDLLPRPNKRLILTSECMQQLLPPPIAALLQADATTRYESVVYFVTKLAFEDACSVAYSYKSCRVPQHKTNMMSEKLAISEVAISEKPGDKNLSKVIQDFTNRTKKLEDDLIRFKMTASIGDVRVECKELMRTVITDRYTKVHASEEVETSDKSTANSFSQPYITELPMPNKLPKGIKCHPL